MIIKKNRQKKIERPLPKEQPLQKSTAAPSSAIEQKTDKENEQNLEKKQTTQTEEQKTTVEKKEETVDIFEGFNFDNIDFNQRAERRRGDRRRGYRRIDDRNMISRAQQEAISIKEQAVKEGFQKGLGDAADVIISLKQEIKNFFEYKDELYEEVSKDILDISLKVAQKIIRREVASDRTILDGIVKEALKSLAKDENKIILKVNPTDVEYTKEIVPDLLSSGQFEAKIYVTGNKDIEEGSAIIETSNGIIDANIRTQLDLIKEAFKQI